MIRELDGMKTKKRMAKGGKKAKSVLIARKGVANLRKQGRREGRKR